MADDSNHPARKVLQAADAGLHEVESRARRLFWPGGLSSRLLILTVLFVALSELLILWSSLATFEQRWLQERISAAELAIMVPRAAVEGVVPDATLDEMRNRSGVIGLALVQQDVMLNYLPVVPNMKTPYLIDLSEQNVFGWLMAPIRTLNSGPDSNVRVRDQTRVDGREAVIEIVAPDAPLKVELRSYLVRLIWLTLFIAITVGVGVYVSLNVFLVKPMQRITLAMERFRADPDDPKAHIDPSGRRDEVGRAEIELNRMQADLRVALNSRTRLAALGEAVAKINHDLRNMVTSAQIASERLAMSGDPSVAQALPRLERALDRAARLTTEVLAYGKSQEPAPAPAEIMLKPAVMAAAEDAGLTKATVKFAANLHAGDRVMADPDHLHRILVNLLKNARQAVTSPEQKRPAEIRLAFERSGGESVIRLSDNGPGVPNRALDRLFTPFTGSGRPGGTGLGLAISRELAQAHGGDLVLKETGPTGSVFEITLPGSLEPKTRPRKKV
jgi:signal transduction histidine kinase